MPQLNSFIQVAFLAASVLLGICFMVDLPTHIGRGLGLWEKVSHPIDAFFLGLSFLFRIKDGFLSAIRFGSSFCFSHRFIFSLFIKLNKKRNSFELLFV
jgi:hypothetical protein